MWDAPSPGGHFCVLHRLEVVRARGLGRWHRWAALSLAVHLATKLFAMRKPGRKSRRRDPNAFGAVCNNSGVERVALLALRCLLALTRASCSAEAEPPPRPGARLRAADSTRARRAAVGSSGAGARRPHRRPQEFAA